MKHDAGIRRATVDGHTALGGWQAHCRTCAWAGPVHVPTGRIPASDCSRYAARDALRHVSANPSRSA